MLDSPSPQNRSGTQQMGFFTTTPPPPGNPHPNTQGGFSKMTPSPPTGTEHFPFPLTYVTFYSCIYDADLGQKDWSLRSPPILPNLLIFAKTSQAAFLSHFPLNSTALLFPPPMQHSFDGWRLPLLPVGKFKWNSYPISLSFPNLSWCFYSSFFLLTVSFCDL